MSQDNLYFFEVEISHCTISVLREGEFSLFLRIGKTQSSFLKAKSYDGKVMVFDSVIRCNCDQSALDTKRFSLTLNVKSSNKENKVLGIVMIPLEQSPKEDFQLFKIAQTTDPDASVQLKYSVNLIGGESNIHKNRSGLSSSLTPKISKDNKKINRDHNNGTVNINQKKKENRNFIDSFFTTPTVSKLPTSQFLEDIKNMQKSQISSQYEEIARLKEVNNQLQRENDKLKREKCFLKELIKVETNKNHLLQKFLDKVYSFFVKQRISDVLSGKKLDRSSKDKLVVKQKAIEEATNKLGNSVSSIGQNSTIKPINQSGQRSRLLQISINDSKKVSDSRISLSKLNSINEDLSSMLKDSIIKQREESNNTIQQLRKVMLDESNLKHQRRLRSVKIKVEKAYLELFKEPQPYTKEHIMRQKISVNKILDELVMCTVVP